MEKDRVFLCVVLAGIGGVAVGSFVTLPLVPLSFLTSALALAFYIVFPGVRTLCLALSLAMFLVGVTLAQGERIRYEGLSSPGPVTGTVRIVGNPEERDTYRRTLLRFVTCEAGACPEERVLWQAPLGLVLPPGARLQFSCDLALPENFAPDFDYRMYLAKEGVGSTCLRGGVTERLPIDTYEELLTLLYHPKKVFERALSLALVEPEAGLAKGLLLGGDHYLPEALKDAFTAVGLSHMIAVSGYNITIIAELLLFLGLWIGLWRYQAIWSVIIGIVFFIIMIGLPASAVRAGTMASIVFVALQLGRLAQPVNALLLAGAVMLSMNPLLFRYDLGFQLSFLATLGILWIAPYQERLLSRLGWFRLFGEILLLTLVVELFVLPIILYSFHVFSPLILIGNFLVWLVPLAMALSFLSGILFLLVPGAHLVVAPFAYATLTLITRSVEWLGSLGALVTVERFGVWHLVSWYVILAIVILIISHNFSRITYADRV